MSGNVVTGFRLGFEGVTLENRLAALGSGSKLQHYMYM